MTRMNRHRRKVFMDIDRPTAPFPPRRYYLDAMYFQMYLLKVILAVLLAISFWFAKGLPFETDILGGPGHLVEWVPGPGKYAWATIFTLLSIGLIASFGRRSIIPVCWVAVVIYLTFAFGFLLADTNFPVALVIGPYFVFAMAHIFLASYISKYGWSNR